MQFDLLTMTFQNYLLFPEKMVIEGKLVGQPSRLINLVD